MTRSGPSQRPGAKNSLFHQRKVRKHSDPGPARAQASPAGQADVTLQGVHDDVAGPSTRPLRVESFADVRDHARPVAHVPKREEQYLNSYGVTEYRDGFFDALFFSPRDVEHEELLMKAEKSLPKALRKREALPLSDLLPGRWLEIRNAFKRLNTSGADVALLKSFVAVFAAYILCLIPTVRAWLGNHSYVMVISAIISHPGRTIGAQIDGLVLTTLGAAIGLGWGSVALRLSSLAAASQTGSGAILAVFQCLFIAAISSVRSYYIRFFQFVVPAGIALFYTCLADVSRREVNWRKIWDFGIPWVLGQALCCALNFVVSPDTGARSYATSLYDAFDAMSEGLVLPAPDRSNTRKRLSKTFVNLSQAYRDLVLDISISHFHPAEANTLRNLLQGVVRALLALEPTPLHHRFGNVTDVPTGRGHGDTPEWIYEQLISPVSDLISSMRGSIQTCAAALMDISGFRLRIGPPREVSADVAAHLADLREQIASVDAAEATLLEDVADHSAIAMDSDLVRILAYCRPIRQAASTVEKMMLKVHEIQQTRLKKPRVYPPSYPLWKAVDRLNAQVRHDRGGVTAGSYYKAFAEISSLIEEIKARQHDPVSGEHDPEQNPQHSPETGTESDNTPSETDRVGYNVWRVLHRLQGYETRYALKVVIVTSLLSLPAWLPRIPEWWNRYESWWAVVIAWIMMHPRVGGNLNDLLIRSGVAALGAVWAGLAYAAGHGNPYVMAVFAALYLIPMLYRYTQSTHPRSGLIGCLSYIIVSLGLVTAKIEEPIAVVAAYRGAAIVVGVVAAVFINWLLWPFVARHELRKASAMMLFFLSITYRNVLGIYVYYEQDMTPTPDDILRSEILEGRIREGFVRIRQLMLLTRHEIRLRAPFDARPYAALTDAAEHFFEHLVALRQSALFFHPRFMTGGAAAAEAASHDRAAESLLSYRRDAVATILTNFYILAGALRERRRVPRYLPSAAAARQRLLDRMAELEEELGAGGAVVHGDEEGERRKWLQIYSYAYNESLTGCAAQLEELEIYTKMIVGEQGFDEIYEDDDDDADEQQEEGNARGKPSPTNAMPPRASR